MTIYKCKYKNSKKLQQYIFDKHDINWGKNAFKILDFNEERKEYNSYFIDDNDYILIFIDSYLTYVKYDYNDFNYNIEFKESIDFDLILRKDKFNRLLNEEEL